MAGFRTRFILAILCMLAGTGLRFLVPLVASGTIDYALQSGTGQSRVVDFFRRTVEQDWLAGHLWAAGLVIFGLTCGAGLFNFMKGKLAAEASDGIARKLKNRLYGHLQRLPMRFFDKAETGDLVQRCTSDVETLRMAISTQVVEVSHALILMGTAIPLMFMIDARMAAVSFALIGPLIAFGYFYIKRVRYLFQLFDEAEGKVTAVVQENLTGLRVVRAFRRQAFEIEKFSGPNQNYRDLGLRLIRLMAIYWSISDFVALSQNALVLGIGLHFISSGSLTVGTLFAFIMLLNLVLWPVRQMGRTLTELGKSTVAIGRIEEILEEAEEGGTPDHGLPTGRGHILARDVTFSHQEGQVALEKVSFEVRPGETLAILGPSGSGKSTLIHLLLRLYDYQSGSIQFDGVEMKELDRIWCREQFATVMQEPFLFSKSIIENIRLGRPSAREKEITRVAQMAHIHETIHSFPSGYKTLVGERGVTLSGGQRQRVALARALLREAPVLLLDDALSAVDTETEEIILDALRKRHGKMTTIVIAHRLSTLSHADRVIVMDQGKIVESGTHEELCRSDGLYRRLWHIQNKEEPGGMEPFTMKN
ncbi:ABC transporter ATP-binding protein [Puniceicoccales bacterium CK1056]|uniref:ABC transporter ATP-binding protein n=2 Tax=Oceanipulchritudo coccoides TaxID=2706888 RepID=A0A6B2LZC1_9BACT|nr:ABC transporter ATP-binding protein [Oceanipulchritudo coccoides]NDV61512.1 ABC transporter ATP-binding protein [Oceanipulchritudo coccoides]